MLLINKKKILSTGLFSILCLKAKGHKLGRLQKKIIGKNNKFENQIKKNLKHILLPLDVGIKIKGKRKNVSVNSFPLNTLALDIGTKTIKLYEKEILKAKKIFWKGTAGDCSQKEFCSGTKRLLKAMEKSKAFCIVSGGHTQTVVEKFKIKKKKMGYFSLSGGALLHYIIGKKLPGLEALK